MVLNNKSSNTLFINVLELFKCSPVQGKVRTKFSIIWHVEGVIDDYGQLKFSLNLAKQVKNYPFLKDANYWLTPLFYVNSPKPQVRKKKVLSREQQAVKYRNLLASGKVKNRAELARKFGVSRAWVTKVLNY